MIVDSSAIVAIFFQEPGHDILISKLSEAGRVGIGAPTLVECGIILSARFNQDARGLLERFLREADIATIPFTEEYFGTAIGAWRKFGKGRHPAAINFGDCLAYAVAKLANMPLLFVGDEFPQTDLLIA